MRIQTRENIFQKDLGNILATGNLNNTESAPEVSKKLFAPNLYKITDITIRDQYILEYTKKLSEYALNNNEKYSTCKSLIHKLKNEAKKHEDTSSDIIEAIDTTIKLFKSAVQKKKDITSESSSTSYGTYPEATCNVLELEKYANDTVFLSNLYIKCKTDSTKNDPELIKKLAEGKKQQLKNHSNSSFPYIDNRIAELNASHVQIGNKVNFILAADPRDAGEVRDHLYHAIVEKDCSLWFTVNESKKSKGPRFWSKESLENLVLPDNWKITNVKEELIEEKSTENKKLNPKLIKSTLIAENGIIEKKIIHYHYDNWRDSEIAPCEKILLQCAKIASKHLQETGTPVGINCTAGISRTGTLANIIYGIQHIEEERKTGKQLSDISINLAELNYDLRKQRPSIVGNPSKFIQVWSILADYVKELQ